jgi:formiminotetrahydrofolate cyclodeaminase
MTEKLSTKTLPDILDAFSSTDPTPGGGSAAALNGAIGASLLAMVAGLPKSKSNTPEERQALDAARATLLDLRATLIDLIDRDAAAYDLVVAAYKHPKGTDEEKAARSAAIQHAMRVATEVPTETMKACAAVLEAAGPVAEFGNPSAKSDVAVGVQTVSAGMQGALFNVEINIGSLKDAALVDAITLELRAAAKQSSLAMPRIYEAGGIFEMMKQTSTRLDMHHHHGPKPGTPEFHQVIARGAAEMLLRLGTPDARMALDTLARSTDADVATFAGEALTKFGAAD